MGSTSGELRGTATCVMVFLEKWVSVPSSLSWTAACLSMRGTENGSDGFHWTWWDSLQRDKCLGVCVSGCLKSALAGTYSPSWRLCLAWWLSETSLGLCFYTGQHLVVLRRRHRSWLSGQQSCVGMCLPFTSLVCETWAVVLVLLWHLSNSVSSSVKWK